MSSVTVTFDTLEATERLKEAGFTEKQATTAVRVITDAQDQLVTKKDLEISLQGLVIKLGVIVAVCNGILFVMLRFPH